MSSRPGRWWLAVVLAVASVGSSAHAEQLYGLLRARDLTPFGFLRLDMRPAYALSIEPGTWALETELGYQNTWALSKNVEDYLVGLEPTGRRPLGQAEVQAIRALPGENYLVDLEAAALDITFHYKFAPNWTGYVIASGVRYGGGFLDSSIEGFHDTLGFSTFGRPAVKRNDFNLIFDLKSSQVVALDAPTDGGVTDPTFGVRYTGINMAKNWQMSIEGAVKVPFGGERLLLSTGRTDYGVQASLQRLGKHHGLYIAGSAVYYAGSTTPVPQGSRIIPTLVFGYERALTPRTNVNIQGYASRSAYTHEQTDLDELLKEKFQYSIGVRHLFERVLLTFAITENVQNINNTPDIGFQLGIAYLPGRK
jgi:hypothetical protein